VGEERKELS
jgi:predicted RNase H-like nuclease (RuvC/YqgF family)